MTGDDHHGAVAESENGEDDEWPGILICVPCKRYVAADESDETTACDHTWDEATDISDLDGETWAKIRHDAYVQELERDPTRVEDQLLAMNLGSLMFDLTMADVLPDDYSDRDGLDKLLVADPDESDNSEGSV